VVENIRKLIRPFITVSLVSTVVYLAIVGKIDPKELLGYTGIIIGYHFGERAALKKPGADN